MSSLRRPPVVASCLIAIALLGALASYLQGTQASARAAIVRGFQERATLAAQLTSGAVNANVESTRAFARTTFDGPGADVQAAVDTDVTQNPQPRVLVLADDGQILGAYPRALRHKPALVENTPALRSALAGEVALTDLFETSHGLALIQAIPYTVGWKRRVWAGGVRVTVVREFADAYLSSALAVASGRAYLVDGTGTIIATTSRESTGDPLPAPLTRALSGDGSGTLADDVFVSATVPTSSWRVVFVAPRDALLAPIQSTRRAAWRLFVVLAGAVLGLLALVAAALNRSARLAHERQHDSLTGLANRALFLDTTERALGALTRRGGHLAALFIDLDRFKPINDRRGHAVGDALLVAVAQRLQSSVRSDDTVSRLGGDEFLVLCPWLESPDEADRIARRIRDAIAQPFDIGGEELTVGCSIGISVHSVQVETIDAATLIANADQAMYRAKEQGRDRIESFDPQLTVAA